MMVPAANGRVLEGRVALVTGGGSGMGRATALLFAQAGACVVVADRVAEAAAETVAAIVRDEGRATACTADVSVEEEVAAMVELAVARYGRLDCAFNNAGLPAGDKPVEDYSLRAWNRTLSVNLTGVWLCMKHEILQMRRQGGPGAIVNNASAWATIGWAGAAPYVAAKHGVIGLTRSAALDHAGDGIRVNAILPGLIETPMSMSMPESVRAAAIAEQPMRRMGRPVEVAQAALWLCSDAASFVSGTSILVDGAWNA